MTIPKGFIYGKRSDFRWEKEEAFGFFINKVLSFEM